MQSDGAHIHVVAELLMNSANHAPEDVWGCCKHVGMSFEHLRRHTHQNCTLFAPQNGEARCAVVVLLHADVVIGCGQLGLDVNCRRSV
eukprot:scaffold44676_cov20-Tisochrysis_lutea.AAC.3